MDRGWDGTRRARVDYSRESYGADSMKFRAQTPPARRIPSYTSIALLSILAGAGVFSIAILLQWLIYDDWLHANGPVRIVGSSLAFVLTSIFVFRWQQAKRREQLAVLRRLETIRWMNDRIRNSLQAIECVVFANHQHVTDPVRDAVDAIENVLEEVLSERHSTFAAPTSLPERGSIEPTA
jgi:hypothetical protein